MSNEERLNLDKIIVYFIVIGMFIIVFLLILDIKKQQLVSDQQLNDCHDALNSFDLYNGKPSDTPFGLDGLYFSNDSYYCIHLSAKDTKKIEAHETCHYLVEQDYNHFCVDYK